MTRNNITQANTIRAYDLIKGNVAQIESMETFDEISTFLTDELETSFSVHNARSIISSVIESGVKMELQVARKSNEPTKGLQLEDIAELLKSLAYEIKRLAKLYEELKDEMSKPVEGSIEGNPSPVEYQDQRVTEPRDPLGLAGQPDE